MSVFLRKIGWPGFVMENMVKYSFFNFNDTSNILIKVLKLSSLLNEYRVNVRYVYRWVCLYKKCMWIIIKNQAIK